MSYQNIAFVIVLLTILGLSHSLPTTFDESEDRIWPIPQFDGTIRYMTREQAIIEAMITEPLAEPRAFDKVRFFLYTKLNPEEPQEIDMDNPDSLLRSFFNSKYPTRFMMHGWNGAYNDFTVNLIRDALLLNAENRNFNFIAVDWSVYGASYTYVTSQTSVSKAGKIVAQFIDWLYFHTKLSFDTLGVYGLSLGAHVAGFTGKHVESGQVHTIVGLDPAMPLFSYKRPASRIADTDGYYVETIQTNGGTLGFYNPIGQAAFYPNGGKTQPGCGVDIGGFCAHTRSVIYFAEALSLEDNNGFDVVQCEEFEDVKEESCSIKADGIRLGDPANAGKARGIYSLTTNEESLFGLNVRNKL